MVEANNIGLQYAAMYHDFLKAIMAKMLEALNLEPCEDLHLAREKVRREVHFRPEVGD